MGATRDSGDVVSKLSHLLVEDLGEDLLVTCHHTNTYAITFADVSGEALCRSASTARTQLGCTSVYFIADAHAEPVVDRVCRALADIGFGILGRSMTPGTEREKSRSSVDRLWEDLAHAGALRRTLIIGVGGGVVCDIAGFVASTYMRGVPYLLVPTTLMAQVDAGIGGKTGFNLKGQKNLVGSFHQPVGVVIDVGLLADLPDRIVAAALGEVLKVAIIGDEPLFELLEFTTPSALKADPTLAGEVVRCAVGEKLRHLAPDPVEVADLRRALNFGHCVGHAVEAELEYAWLHGECVAVGIAVACRVAVALGVLDPRVQNRIEGLLRRWELPVNVPDRIRARVWDHLTRIGRVRNGPLNLVVPTRIGAVTILPAWPAGVPWTDVC